MKIQGERRLAFPRQRVWEALMDPEVLARTLPGCRSLERDGDDAFTGRLQVTIGPVQGDFRGRLELADVEPLEGYRMRLDGRGPSGFMRGEGRVDLLEEDSGAATLLTYDLDAQVGGRIAGLGQRLLESSGKAVAQQGLDGLERQLAAGAEGEGEEPEAERQEERPGAEAAAAAVGSRPPADGGAATEVAADKVVGGPRRPPAPEPPSQVEFAVGVARRVAADTLDRLVPPDARPWAIFVAGLLLGLLLGRRPSGGGEER